MSEYYTAKKTRGLFKPDSPEPFKLSRSKIDLFIECPRCFYLDRRLGIGRPPGFPFNLNSAVDHLLKKEFDVHRAHKTQHPLMKAYGLKAIPFDHEEINTWRENFIGIQYHHTLTHFLITGAVDDIWINHAQELHVVDYKATSKDAEVNLDADWQDGYKRQMEVYQWLLRHKGFLVSSTGYFVYANGKRDRNAFDGKLEFDVKIIPYIGNDEWIEKTLLTIRACLIDERIPKASSSCDYCNYAHARMEVEHAILPSNLLSKKNKKNNDKQKDTQKYQQKNKDNKNTEGRQTLF